MLNIFGVGCKFDEIKSEVFRSKTTL